MSGTGGGMRFSEVFDLPLTIDVRTAARMLGLCPATVYRRLKEDDFPCPVLRPGWQYRIPTAGMLRAMGIEEIPVHAEDLQRGAEYAAAEDADPEDRT
ncbi:hypothetical protein Kpho01_12950 [Kitasatospora phosalacinea]|uniref:Helix-turn-helix domain-containing protein n=2 Tax=Kitasatospora phosalacinea TaxID=2065 RepID=A0A9W6PE22_9ACTN|nr:hypothetical protein Kpho01_12950 [Kitasatospora phosalacinea]